MFTQWTFNFLSSLLWPPGGAVLAAQRRAGVVLGDGSHRGVSGRRQQGSPQTLPPAGLEQPDLPPEDDSTTTTQMHARTHTRRHVLTGSLALTGSPAHGFRRQAGGVQRGVQELSARLPLLLHGALPGPGRVDGEAAGVHPQRGHFLHRCVAVAVAVLQTP